MKRSRCTEEQIIGILEEHEAGVSVVDLCRKHGVNDASIYKWKAKFGGIEGSEAKRLKTSEDENTRLKRLFTGEAIEHHQHAVAGIVDEQLVVGRMRLAHRHRQAALPGAVELTEAGNM